MGKVDVSYTLGSSAAVFNLSMLKKLKTQLTLCWWCPGIRGFEIFLGDSIVHSSLKTTALKSEGKFPTRIQLAFFILGCTASLGGHWRTSEGFRATGATTGI